MPETTAPTATDPSATAHPALAETQRILSRLIAFPSVSSDSNSDLIAWLAGHLEASGARCEILESPDGRKANLWATIGPDRPGGIVLSGHSDVVPVADQDWTTDPFEMREADGLLYGRGACDMKGFIAACVAMAPHFAAAIGDRPDARPVHFAFTYDEEVGCIGAAHLVEILRTRPHRPDIAIIGEPTMMKVIEGHKGIYECCARFTGLEGHGSAPDKGVSAVEYATRYVSRLLELREDLRGRAPADSRFDPPWSTVNIGVLHGGAAHNIIPGKAVVEWEMRPVQQSDRDLVVDALADLVPRLDAEMKRTHPGAGILSEVVGEVAGLEPMDDNAARDLVFALTGANSAETVAFCTEAGLFQSMGMDAVICGPGSIEQAHKPDEYVSLSQMSQCLDMLEGLALKL